MRQNSTSIACGANYSLSQAFYATPNQAYSNLVPPPMTEQYHRFTVSNRYTAIVQTRSSTAATSRLHTLRARLNRFEAGFKPPPRSGLQTSLRTGS